ncbi:MAG: DUF3313 family protein [Candidatus Reddybacter sp.]
MSVFQKIKTTLLVTAVLLTVPGVINASEQVTDEGLVLQANTKFREVYLKPGAKLAAYNTYGLFPCKVAFRKDWARDQNKSRVGLHRRVTQKDVERIKKLLSKECDRFFREALEVEPAYTLVDQFSNGDQVLILRPAIINLDITAPDLMTPGMTRTFTTSAGQMTLYLEALDATTGEILVRVIDRRKSMKSGSMRWTNSITNRAEANRALQHWANLLRKALDHVSGS